MRPPAAIAFTDQLDAATDHARATLATIAPPTGATVTHGTPSPWLTGHLSALRDALCAGQVRSCVHLTGGPTVAYAAIWAPARLVCGPCIHLLQPTPDEELRCDRCRRTAPVLHPGLVASGPILLAYGLCDSCRTPAPPADPTTDHPAGSGHTSVAAAPATTGPTPASTSRPVRPSRADRRARARGRRRPAR